MSKINRQHSRIENTAEHPRPEWVLGGNPAAIEAQESAGQRQLVNSDRLPTKGSDDPRLLELGFTFGDPDPGDPMFRPATLPQGWKREGSEHAMWSYLLDERGIERVSIFYKAAFYDRSAFMSLTGVGGALASRAIYGDGPVTGPWDKLTPDEITDVRAAAQRYIAEAEQYPQRTQRTERAREVIAAIEALSDGDCGDPRSAVIVQGGAK